MSHMTEKQIQAMGTEVLIGYARGRHFKDAEGRQKARAAVNDEEITGLVNTIISAYHSVCHVDPEHYQKLTTKQQRLDALLVAMLILQEYFERTGR